MKIIALDDEAGALKLLERAIRANCPDDELKCFSAPEEALKECRVSPPDVAFLDVNMPGMTGLQAAKKLKSFNPNVNIVFVTGYSEYAPEAFSMRASGYLTKPVTSRDIKKELENLRNPVIAEETEKGIFAKTFGNFDLFVNGRSISFQRGPAKEVLAYLIDRHGSTVTRKELAAVLFEDMEYSRSTQSYMTQILKSLMTALEGEGISDIIISGYNSYAVDVSKIRCDAYEFLKGNPEAINSFAGEYMSQYSWAEEHIGLFCDFSD